MSTSSETWQLGGQAIRVTHLENVYWPQTGFTRGDLLHYYQQIAPVMLPYLKDRPVTLRVFPKGESSELPTTCATVQRMPRPGSGEHHSNPRRSTTRFRCRCSTPRRVCSGLPIRVPSNSTSGVPICPISASPIWPSLTWTPGRLPRLKRCVRLRGGCAMSLSRQESGVIQKRAVGASCTFLFRSRLVQAARAAARTKNSYLSAQYHRTAARRGDKRAAVAVGHSILVIYYHMLKTGQPYQEKGGDSFSELDRHHAERRLTKQLERLGYQVTLTPAEIA